MGMPGVVVCGAAEGRGLGLDWTGLDSVGGGRGDMWELTITNYGGDGKWSGSWVRVGWVRLD